MKYNGIIYPNTPYFRKYAGKMRLPVGGDDRDVAYLFEKESTFFFLNSKATTITVALDGTELTENTDYTISDASEKPIDSTFAAMIAEVFPDEPLFTGYWYYIFALTTTPATGDHTLTVTTADGNEVSVEFTVEE